MSKYVMENAAEFDRLEKQSQSKAFDFESELIDFSPKISGSILDAGCGSGVVSRYLAQKFPEASVIGCDASAQRIDQATAFLKAQIKTQTKKISNLVFKNENLNQLSFESSSFDGVVCRYVLEHLDEENLTKALAEFHRCLRPKGVLCAIDIDGYLFNVFPQTELMKEMLSKIATQKAPDLHVGRKLPLLISSAGFKNVSWRIETLQFQGKALEEEIHLIQERFEQAMPFLISLSDHDSSIAQQFVSEYLQTLRSPNATLFYNKFIVLGEKTRLRLA